MSTLHPFRIFLLLSFLFFSVAQATTATLTLKGYLGKDELAAMRQTLDRLEGQPPQSLIIDIDSSTGDLNQVLSIAKRLYSLKVQDHTQIIVYIQDSAVGPVAMIPFLADRLYISPFVSWGDIAAGNEGSVPTNLLRNQVTSFVSDEHAHADLLKLIAAAMSDKSLQVIDDNGWKLSTNVEDKTHPRVSTVGEPLVVNHVQLKKLDLIAGVLTPQQFYQQMKLSETEQQQMNAPPATVLEMTPSTLDAQLAAHIKFSPTEPNYVGHIVIEDRTSGINQSTWLYVKQALNHYQQSKPIFVILELNTPGGEVYAAQQISDALKDLDTQFNIPVIAFINNWAISAGAMLTYSCRFIAIVKDASMGAAEPVMAVSTGEMKEASEKVNSALRSDFANRARFFGRNPYIAEAMVDKDTILVLRHGKIIKLDLESQVRTTGPDPDIIISPKGKLLTLNAEQLMQYGVADMRVLPAKLEPITAAEKEKGQWPASKSLLFQQPFLASIPHTIIDSYQMDWKTRFFVFLANPAVASLLLLGLMMGFYFELSHPGFGLPGTVAAVCLFLIVLSSLSLEIANWLEVILLLTGIAVVLVDIFLLPTFGLLGIVGIILFCAGLFGMMLPNAGAVHFDFDTKTLNSAGEAFFERLAWLAGTLLLGFLLILLAARYVTPTIGSWSRLVLTGSEQEGYIAGESPKDLPQPGSRGEVLATLRPAGKVLINDKVYDALTAGNFIDKGTPIVVARLEGSVIVVDVAPQEKES